jgi:hypothetical protein
MTRNMPSTCFALIVLSAIASLSAGCAGLPKRDATGISVVTMTEAPAAVHSAIVAVAKGRRIEKINRVRQLEGPVYRAYIADKLGSQLLTLNGHGQILDNAVVIPFADMPAAVRKSAQTGVAGKLETCRKSIVRPQPTYIVDYMLGEDEPAFAIIDATGFVHALVGYAEEDPD